MYIYIYIYTCVFTQWCVLCQWWALVLCCSLSALCPSWWTKFGEVLLCIDELLLLPYMMVPTDDWNGCVAYLTYWCHGSVCCRLVAGGCWWDVWGVVVVGCRCGWVMGGGGGGVGWGDAAWCAPCGVCGGGCVVEWYKNVDGTWWQTLAQQCMLITVMVWMHMSVSNVWYILGHCLWLSHL